MSRGMKISLFFWSPSSCKASSSGSQRKAWGTVIRECRNLERGFNSGTANVVAPEEGREVGTYWIGDLDVVGTCRRDP